MNLYKSLCVLMDFNGFLRVLIGLDAFSLVFMSPYKSLCILWIVRGAYESL